MKTLKKLILTCSLIGIIGLFSGCAQLLDAYSLSQNSWYMDGSMPGVNGYFELNFNYADLTYTRIFYKEGKKEPYTGIRGKWIVEPDTDSGKSILTMTTTDTLKGGLGDIEVNAADDSQWTETNVSEAKYNYEITSSKLVLKPVGYNTSETWTKFR